VEGGGELEEGGLVLMGEDDAGGGESVGGGVLAGGGFAFSGAGAGLAGGDECG
jgi:hypothetical protein